RDREGGRLRHLARSGPTVVELGCRRHRCGRRRRNVLEPGGVPPGPDEVAAGGGGNLRRLGHPHGREATLGRRTGCPGRSLSGCVRRYPERDRRGQSDCLRRQPGGGGSAASGGCGRGQRAGLAPGPTDVAGTPGGHVRAWHGGPYAAARKLSYLYRTYIVLLGPL